MKINNILLKDLYKVLAALPKGTKKIDIEYIDNEEETKIVIYPAEDELDSGYKKSVKKSDNDPGISPDEDLINYL